VTKKRFRVSGVRKKDQMTENRGQMTDYGSWKSGPLSPDKAGLWRGKHAEVGKASTRQDGGQAEDRNEWRKALGSRRTTKEKA
jgi:hypothetical protein